MSTLISDSFSGLTLDAGKWTSETKHPANALSINDSLYLSIGSTITTNIRVISVLPVPTTGQVSITLTYTPGTRGGGGSGVPYMALRPATISRDAYYDAPIGVPMMSLGLYSDTTTLTRLPFGVSGSAAYLITGASPIIALPTGTAGLITWVIDWATHTMSAEFNGSVIAANVGFTYTAAAPLYWEIANSGYNTSSNRTEAIDNVLITVPSLYKLAGTLKSQDGIPISRELRARRRDTGALIAQVTTAQNTGVWEVIAPNTLVDLQFLALPGDGCDLFLPGRTPVEML